MGKSVLYKVYLGADKRDTIMPFSDTNVRRLQAVALGIADRNVGKVSGRTEFYQRLKALNVAPVKEPTKGQAVIVGVPSVISIRISAIKALCELTSLGLKEAKDAIDAVNGNCGIPQANYHFPLTDMDTANRQAKVMREAGCTVQVNLS